MRVKELISQVLHPETEAKEIEAKEINETINEGVTGRMIITGVAGLTAIGGFVADFNKTHLYNPRWTPHSKFHDALSILLGGFLGGTGIYLLLREKGDREFQRNLGTLLPAFFWSSMLASFAFPGAGGLEEEFPKKVPKIAGIRLNERPISMLMLGLLGLGWVMDRYVPPAERREPLP